MSRRRPDTETAADLGTLDQTVNDQVSDEWCYAVTESCFAD